MDKQIIHYYQHEYDEGSRLNPESIEFTRTMEIISRYLRRSGIEILDIGGATGIYSFALAALGNSVHLVDLTPRHIETALEISRTGGTSLASAAIGDARSLDFPDDTFDAVLLFGPLYHLTDRRDRIDALRESRRVLKPGGLIFCAAISRYASMIDGFMYDRIADDDFVEIMHRDLKDGQHRDKNNKRYFTTAFFHAPEELENEIAESGFTNVELFAVESVSELIPDLSERMRDERFKRIMLDTIRQIERDRTFIGMTAHLLGVARKPDA